MKKFFVCMVLMVLFGSYNTNVKAVDDTETAVDLRSLTTLPPHVTEKYPEDGITTLVGTQFSLMVIFESPEIIDVEISFVDQFQFRYPLETLTVDGSVNDVVAYIGTWYEAAFGRIEVKLTVQGTNESTVTSFDILVLDLNSGEQ